jgi:restriction endonuclease S subunit
MSWNEIEIRVADANHFETLNGLWTGKKAPFVEAGVIRNTNFSPSGEIDYSNIAYLLVEAKQLTKRRLEAGDIILERSGGGPKQPVGRVVYFDRREGVFSFSNFTSTIRVKDKNEFDPRFVFYRLMELYQSGRTEDIQRRTTGIRNLDFTAYKDRACVPNIPLPEQKKIALILSTVQRAIEAQERIIKTTTELKTALMHKLFSDGLRGEPQKQTEIGLVPESWATPAVESVCAIKASAMSYSQLENTSNVANGVNVIGIKVSDMNLPGNEIEFRSANLERQLSEKEALKRTVPKNSIVFPKRGAAIATNKKRLTTCYTVVDPNLIAVMPSEAVNHRYLFHWFTTFDLRKITDPGPTPQLNKKDIAPLKFPMPPIDEQKEIATAIDAAEEKARLHYRKCKQLQDLFRTLLHELMSAKIRVSHLNLNKEAP